MLISGGSTVNIVVGLVVAGLGVFGRTLPVVRDLDARFLIVGGLAGVGIGVAQLMLGRRR